MEMEGELSNFIKVWLSIYTSLGYCYLAGKVVPKGTTRLLAILPVVSLFLFLPLHLHSVHLIGITAFFTTWLANFKLLLYAFGKGPLSDPSLSLPLFISVACFPIRIQKNPDPEIPPNPKSGHKSPFNYALKGLLLAVFLKVYDYSEYLHPKLLLFIYSFHIYFALEIILAVVAALVRAVLGLELEPQFDEPYLSSSLQDFWGRRWNMMVSRVLKPTVYEPAIGLWASVLGRKWAPIPAVLSTFAVSGLMHELIFYYLGRVKPSWEITGFFLLHGVCLVVEIAVKKACGGAWRVPRVVSAGPTFVFVMLTGFWLFFPPLLRCDADVRALEEYAVVGAFFKEVGGKVLKLTTSA